jgi:hypothetical protein
MTVVVPTRLSAYVVRTLSFFILIPVAFYINFRMGVYRFVFQVAARGHQT